MAFTSWCYVLSSVKSLSSCGLTLGTSSKVLHFGNNFGDASIFVSVYILGTSSIFSCFRVNCTVVCWHGLCVDSILGIIGSFSCELTPSIAVTFLQILCIFGYAHIFYFSISVFFDTFGILSMFNDLFNVSLCINDIFDISSCRPRNSLCCMIDCLHANQHRLVFSCLVVHVFMFQNHPT